MNLFIGVILDGFDAASASDHDVITQDDFARFAHHWAEYDPRATCLISVQASCVTVKCFAASERDFFFSNFDDRGGKKRGRSGVISSGL